MSKGIHLNVYQPKTYVQAMELLEKFKQMGVNPLDEEKFYYLFSRGNGEIGFCKWGNTWQVCQTESDEFFEVNLVEL